MTGRPARAVLGTVFAVAAAIGLSAGCNNRPPTPGAKVQKVATDLTETAARQRITAYLTQTLRALPAGVGLSRRPDNPNLARLDDGDAAITVPCDDNDISGDGPEQVQLGYWVVGVPAGQNSHFFDLIRDAWTGRGFILHPEADSRWAPVFTPDGYTLVVQDAGKGDGSLSINTGSPCFPLSGKDATTPQPNELHRPS